MTKNFMCSLTWFNNSPDNVKLAQVLMKVISKVQSRHPAIVLREMKSGLPLLLYGFQMRTSMRKPEAPRNYS